MVARGTRGAYARAVVGFWILGAMALGGCESKAGGGGAVSPGGGVGGAGGGGATCRDSCPKSCTSDADCDLSDGEICCSYGSVGAACVEAKDCPRFCDSDATCDSSEGEICCRTSLVAPEKTCEEAKECVVTCASTADCGDDLVCCTSLATPACVKGNDCPAPCAQSQDCDTDDGEVCCLTVRDFELATRGYTAFAPGGTCMDPDESACPQQCSSSQECPKDDPLCCPSGFCAKSCDTACTTNDDCDLSEGEFCCGSQVLRSPWYDD